MTKAAHNERGEAAASLELGNPEEGGSIRGSIRPKCGSPNPPCGSRRVRTNEETDESRESQEAREQEARAAKTAVICDSLPLWVTALSELATSSNIEVVGTACQPTVALELISQLQPALFITEIDADEGEPPTSRSFARRAGSLLICG